MSATNGPKIVKDGLIVNLDSANGTAFKGIPTTNLSPEYDINIYNNQGAGLATTLVKTTDTYRGAPIWKATYTPQNSTVAGYLNTQVVAGVGVYITGATTSGAGLANTYTGYSIFFKSDKPIWGIMNSASNVVGYQPPVYSYDDMGDGWYRANVFWYDTVTRVDNKYWNILPLNAAVGETITYYWAGPFKESRNDSTLIAPYVNTTRGTTVATDGGWEDTSGFNNHGTFNGTPRYSDANQGSLVFNGTDHFITLNDLGNLPSFSIEGWFNLSALPGVSQYPCVVTNVYPGINSNMNFVLGFQDVGVTASFGGSFFASGWRQTPTFVPNINTWYHCVFTYDGKTLSFIEMAHCLEV
jgi:hypothetical protein